MLTDEEKKYFQDSSSFQPLLSESDEESSNHRPGPRKSRRFVWEVIIHLALLAVYTTVFFAGNSWYRTADCHRPLTYTPAQNAIQYQRVAFNGSLEQGNPYKGPPRPELDKAWHDLLEHSNIRLSEDNMRKLNRTSVKLADGSGAHLGGLNVHHHLHCLKYVRQYLHRDYYQAQNLLHDPNLEEHIDHCLDDIRQALMCKADTAILTYDWIPNYRKPYPNFQIDNECVDWENLMEWAGERSFSLFDQKSLVHPTLGLSFPLVNGSVETDAVGMGLHFVRPEGEGRAE